MAELVERRIDDALLEAPVLHLTEAEQATLALPRAVAAISIRADADDVRVEWQPRQRVLRGEALADHIQLYGQLGGLLRIYLHNERLHLEVLRSGTAATRSTSARDAAPTATTTPLVDRAEHRARRRRQQRRAKRRQDRFRLRTEKEFRWHADVGLYKPSLDAIAANLAAGGWDRRDLFQIRLEMEELSATDNFDELLAIDLAAIDHMAHQEGAARKVLGQLRGRAVLADEVGLGKTIEAGLITKELVLRGLARRILVLTPATLREQWRDELQEKFGESFALCTASDRFDPDADRVIMSLPLAVRLAERITAKPWDLVIVDEAHKFTGRGAVKTQDVLRALDSRYLLCLTATPVQNDLLELYRLVDLLRPGTFQSDRDFRDRFCGADRRTPSDPAQLRRLVADVMVRTTREQAGIDKVTRYPVDVPIDLDPVERTAYQICVDVLRHVMTGDGDRFRRRNLAHRLTTSPRGLARSAAKLADAHPDPAVRERLRELADIGLDLGPGSRQRALLLLLRSWIADPTKGKVIVFTQHTDTLEDLVRVLDEHGIDTAVFHGGLAPATRQTMIQRFRNEVPVLLSTDAGAEGLNLQFANCVVNYDLPWNPMRIEQRIGRVHRVTQTRDVHVANFFARDTVDEHVYHILHDKLRMFELLFGQVTTILGEIDDSDGATFESRILNAITAHDDRAMQTRLQQLGDRIAGAFDRAQESIHASAHLGWMTDKRYRADLPGHEATELMPNLEHVERQRHRRAAQLVRTVIEQLGGEIVHEDLGIALPGREQVPEFFSARFDPEIADELQLPGELHLAFTSEALQRHRDAELCAVGSEIFDDLLDAVRDRGDLHATITADVPIASLNEPPHRPSLERQDVVVLGPTQWAAACHWRVTLDNAEAGSSFMTTYLGPTELLDHAARLGHRAELAEGLAAPLTIPPVGELLEEAVATAHAELTPVLDVHTASQRMHHDAERERQIAAYRARLAERASAGTADTDGQAQRIERAIEKLEERRLSKARLTAELISIELVGGGAVRVEERWRTGAAQQSVLAFDIDPDAAGPHRIGHDGHPIDVLDACREGHLVDHQRLRTCATCGGRACEACGPQSVLQPCACCGELACGRCCPPGGVCTVCAAPTRDPGLDRSGQRAWRLGERGVLLVSATAASLERPGGGARHFMAAARPPSRLHRHLAQRGLPLDASVSYEAPAELCSAALVIASVANTALHWAVDERPGDLRASGDDATARSALEAALDDTPPPIEPACSLPPGMASLLERLRSLDPVEPLRLRVTGQVAARWVQVTTEGMSQRTGSATGAQAGAVTVEQDAAWQLSAGNDGIVAIARIGALTVAVRSLHRSFLLEVSTPDGPQHRFLPSDAGCTLGTELVLATVQRLLQRAPGTEVRLLDVLAVAPDWDDTLVPVLEPPPVTVPAAFAAPVIEALRVLVPTSAVPALRQPVDGTTLPSAYGAAGLDLYGETSPDHGAVYVISGAGRCEAVHVAPDRRTTWWTFDGSDPNARLALALAQLMGRGNVVAALAVKESAGTAADERTDRLILRARRRRRATVTSADHARTLALPVEPHPVDALAAALAGAQPLPLPVLLTEAGRRLIAAPARASELERVEVTIDESEELIQLTADGLIRVRRTQTGRTEDVAPWIATGEPMRGDRVASGDERWPRRFDVIGTTELDGVTAELLRSGWLSWARTTTDDATPALHALETNEPTRLATGLGDLLGFERPRVIAFRDPATITPPTVRNATLVARRWVPTARIVDTVRGAPDRTMDAASSLHVAAAAVPEAAQPAGPLWDALRDRIRSAAEVQHVEVDLDVVDLIEAPAGRLELRYRLLPGDAPGCVVAADTGAPASELTVDRHGHLAAAPHTCPHCNAISCAACSDDTRPCSVCAVPTCGDCAHPVSDSPPVPEAVLCPTCRSMRHPLRLGRLNGGGRSTHASDDEAATRPRTTEAEATDGDAPTLTLTERRDLLALGDRATVTFTIDRTTATGLEFRLDGVPGRTSVTVVWDVSATGKSTARMTVGDLTFKCGEPESLSALRNWITWHFSVECDTAWGQSLATVLGRTTKVRGSIAAAGTDPRVADLVSRIVKRHRGAK